jgi:hypothetical protein
VGVGVGVGLGEHGTAISGGSDLAAVFSTVPDHHDVPRIAYAYVDPLYGTCV